VVGIAERRSHGCGIREPADITKQIFFGLAGSACCEGSTTLFLPSPAKADAQSAKAKAPIAHRTDQPHPRLSLLPFPMP
jgi:hypothetical protein